LQGQCTKKPEVYIPTKRSKGGFEKKSQDYESKKKKNLVIRLRFEKFTAVDRGGRSLRTIGIRRARERVFVCIVWTICA